jgi:two-component system, chemotaxis family, CheB/CheR fusion protein
MAFNPSPYNAEGGPKLNTRKKSLKAAIQEETATPDIPQNTGLSGFPIVGIGASAGGLAAFEAFFSGMPGESDPGMAFVLVQHLAPDHKSILTELIRRYTHMLVFEVEDGMAVKPNCAYIIPPNRDMAFLNGTLQLLEPSAPHGHRMPIDFFFRSLAQDQHERAICIVLSGTGSDGTQGVRAVKGEGGMVMAQDPASTEYDGMPRSAIATGLVDYQLPPVKMAAQLIAYVDQAFGHPPVPSAETSPKVAGALKKIFVLLRAQTGHDFSQYKPSTIHRRIERRLAVHQIKGLDQYVKYLQQTPAEVDALYRDLLIGVTSFFRDPEAFKFVEEQVIPRLFSGKPAGSVIRVWSAGCSSGEEAYSLAILLQEHLEKIKKNYKIQVFATDLDSQAIATARGGVYPAGIAADIPPERLAGFFTAESDGAAYRIHKSIRDLIVFSEQDLVKDPPFSKLDLVVCRNLLIYMGADLQKRLIALFQFALIPGGFLFLGTAETVGELADMFLPLSRKLKIYQRREGPHGILQLNAGRFSTFLTGQEAAVQRDIVLKKSQKLTPREVTEQALLKQVAPAAALVNARGDILYLHGRTGMYLEPPQGEPGVSNILKMAREGLRFDLTAALHKAVMDKVIVSKAGLSVKSNGSYTPVNLTVRPVETKPGETAEPPLCLVILDEGQPLASGQSAEGMEAPVIPGVAGTEEAILAALKKELQEKEEYLQTANEELETANEELKSSNEEMQSVNEELQSTNEELETSKEELQSVNEELSTVNTELQAKVIDLARANNDMNNLLSGTGIATVFVDHQLRILRFTPTARLIINLIPGDLGRPLGHILSNLTGYNSLIEDIQAVLKTLVPREVAVQAQDGRWFTLRIQPYRTIDNVIEGAVINFVDVTEIKQAEAKIRELESLKIINQAKSELLANVSHELRTPLASIKGFIETLIENDVTWTRKQQLEFLQSADKETDRLILLIKDLLDMSRIDSGKMVLDKRLYKISEILDSAAGVLSIIAARHKLAINTLPDLPSIMADKVRIVQVVTNLVENAAKFSKEGSRIEIAAGLDGNRLLISVEDWGTGMSPEVIANLFNRFYQAKQVVEGKTRGTGLGLAICKGIVEAHGGNIRVESQAGKGSKFCIALPFNDLKDKR